jgi:hypothetical protein
MSGRSRAEKIGAVSIIVAIAAIGVAVIVPELRKWAGLDQVDQIRPVATQSTHEGQAGFKWQYPTHPENIGRRNRPCDRTGSPVYWLGRGANSTHVRKSGAATIS